MIKNIDKIIKKNEIYWPMWFDSFIFDDTALTENENKMLIDFIIQKISFGYENQYSNKFRPLAQFTDGRTSIYDDLTDSDFETIKVIISNTDNIFLLAKCNELLYIKTNDVSYCETAIDNFIKIVDYYIALNKIYEVDDYLKHLLYLSKSIDDKNRIKIIIDNYVFDKNYQDNKLEDIINLIFDFFDKCSYHKYDKKKLIDLIESLSISESDRGLLIINNVINYYSSNHDLIEQNIWINKYADLSETLCAKYSPKGYHYLKKAIEILSKQGEYNYERINDLRFKLEEEQAKFYDSLHFVKLSDPYEENKELGQFIKHSKDLINKENDSIRKFICFLGCFNSVTSKQLDIFTKTMSESVFMNIMTQVIFDKNKRVVAEIESDDIKEKNKQNIIEAYNFYHPIYYDIALDYIKTLVLDEQLKSLIEEIISHNEFVPKDRINIVSEYVKKGFNKEIRLSLYNLIAQFENGCVNYLKNKKRIYPIIKKGNMSVKIDLNHILTDVKFRNSIVEILGEDLTKELQYLLVENRYGNLRNTNYHEAYSREDICNNFELLAFFKLVNVFCIGYDSSI